LTVVDILQNFILPVALLMISVLGLVKAMLTLWKENNKLWEARVIEIKQHFADLIKEKDEHINELRRMNYRTTDAFERTVGVTERLVER
jgi:hypothetical protein